MAGSNAFFKVISRLLYFYISIELIVQLKISATESDPATGIAYKSIPFARKTSKTFTPLPIKFPNTTRTGADAEKYLKVLDIKMNGRGRKGDKNLKMTGESCALGLGHLYKV